MLTCWICRGARVSSASALYAPLLRASPLVLNVAVADPATLEVAVAAHDLVISLVLPRSWAKTHVFTTLYISPALCALDGAARAEGIVVLNKSGLDPGIDHLSAVKVIDGVHTKGGKVKEFHLQCGALAAPDCAGNPLGYKSPGIRVTGSSPSSTSCPSSQTAPSRTSLVRTSWRAHSRAPSRRSHPRSRHSQNRDSVPFRAFLRIPEAHPVVCGTLQYVGFVAFMAVLGKIGWLAADVKEWAGVARGDVAGARREYHALIAHIKEVCAFPSDSESAWIISGMWWMGLFSPEKFVVRGGTLLDTLDRRRHARRWCRPHGERAAVHHQELTSVSITPHRRARDPNAHLPVPGDVAGLDHALEQRIQTLRDHSSSACFARQTQRESHKNIRTALFCEYSTDILRIHAVSATYPQIIIPLEEDPC
ncbi:hypothetical protein B0H14DRAFT_3520581 [Mycena olivaceomarginata]|nr:hypothetical protein B0H14DRAFT_3520581 [Mycena olivaceomarginata]